MHSKIKRNKNNKKYFILKKYRKPKIKFHSQLIINMNPDNLNNVKDIFTFLALRAHTQTNDKNIDKQRG